MRLSIPQWYCWSLYKWLSRSESIELDELAHDRVRLSDYHKLYFWIDDTNLIAVDFDEDGITLASSTGFIALYNEDVAAVRFDYHKSTPHDIAKELRKVFGIKGRWSDPRDLPPGYDEV